MSKGSIRRPGDQDQYREGYDRIWGNKVAEVSSRVLRNPENSKTNKVACGSALGSR